MRRPAIFAETAAWLGSAFAAREMAGGDVVASLRCLREVTAEHLPASASAVIDEHLAAAIARLERGTSPRPDPPDHDRLTLTFLERVLSGRRDEAVRALTEAAAGGRSVESIYLDVLQPAMAEIGRMWHAAEIGVADEHFATETAGLAMSLLRDRATPSPPRGRCAVAGAVAGDLHSIGVRMVAELLELDGWEVIYLGANVPADELLRVATEGPADLLALSATSVLVLRDLGGLIDAMRRQGGMDRTRIIVGGGPFNRFEGLWREIGADGWAPTAREAVAEANRLAAAAR